ncbi:MAG TPA: TrmH family RNA methyltransferase [Polyangiaceae bacterium]
MPLARPLEATPEEVRALLGPIRSDFSVALAGPGNPFSIGAVIRVAHSYLAREVFVLGDGDWYPKGSMGMEKYETVVRLPDGAALRAAVGRRPLWAVEREHARRNVNAVRAFPPGVVFVFGSERFGVPEELLAAADEVVGIPLYGVNNSLPVTVAAGIVMNEWARRRYAAGATL